MTISPIAPATIPMITPGWEKGLKQNNQDNITLLTFL
jgi:hypothetical protein